MTDSDQRAPESGSAPTDELRRGSHAAFWVIAVFGAFLALAALWFAVFASPQPIGPDVSATSSVQDTSPTASGAAGANSGLTVADVSAVLAQVEYSESNDSSATEYAHMVAHLQAGVDVAAFARSALESTSAIWWQAPGAFSHVYLTGTQKQAISAQAVQFYRSAEASTGEAGAIDGLLSAWFSQPVPSNSADSFRMVVGQGLAPLGLMFGARDADNEWTWHVDGVAITGPDSADVTYSATTLPTTKWSFVDPAKPYVKHLKFAKSASGRWRLAGWSNYPEVNAEFRSNVAPSSTVIILDEWWGGL
jgi:hypothetical protein